MTAPDDLTLNREEWSCRHFSLSNPGGPGRNDVPKLLRALAEKIEGKGQIEIRDVVFSSGLSDGDDDPTFTVYFERLGSSQ